MEKPLNIMQSILYHKFLMEALKILRNFLKLILPLILIDFKKQKKNIYIYITLNFESNITSDLNLTNGTCH
jgi:hypothetical protein